MAHRRREHMQNRVLGLTIYYPIETASLVYVETTFCCNPVVLTPHKVKNDSFWRDATPYSSVRTDESRGIDRESLYACTEHEWESFISSKSYVISTVQALILDMLTNTTLVNTFEIEIPVLTHKMVIK